MTKYLEDRLEFLAFNSLLSKWKHASSTVFPPWFALDTVRPSRSSFMPLIPTNQSVRQGVAGCYGGQGIPSMHGRYLACSWQDWLVGCWSSMVISPQLWSNYVKTINTYYVHKRQYNKVAGALWLAGWLPRGREKKRERNLKQVRKKCFRPCNRINYSWKIAD